MSKLESLIYIELSTICGRKQDGTRKGMSKEDKKRVRATV